MQRTELLRTVFVLLASLVGTAALFLPFTYGVSPWMALRSWSVLTLLGAPLILALPILASQVRKFLPRQLSAFEITVAYVLSAAAMISVLAYTALLVLNKGVVEALVAIASCWMLAVANIVLLWRNFAKRATREATAEAFLLGGYLPTAVFCLLAFGWNGKLQIGAYLIAAVSLGYLAAIVLLSRETPGGTPRPAELTRTEVAEPRMGS